jgi:ATP-dependent exoDNAse (exonuclease V) alpha subunit
LKQNKRLDNSSEEDRQYAKWLLDIGHGRNYVANSDFDVVLDPGMKCGDTAESLVQSIYPGLNALDPAWQENDNWFLKRTILSARNDNVDELNQQCLNALCGNEIEYLSADSAIVDENAEGGFQYPIEYLNTIKGSGLPLSKLKLKIGAPIMILRNLDPSNGVCNGTRAVLTAANTRVLEARIIRGDHGGQKIFIPRLTIIPSNLDLPFTLKRRQFPVRLAFAMSINKSQGQSVDHVGLDLRTAVFTHGQLYVALSRCTSSQRVKVLFSEGKDSL